MYDESLPHSEKLVSVPTDIAAVKEHARKLSVTPAAVYLAAAQLTFGRYVCEDTAAIATISGGRRNLKLSDTMGMFVNTLPIVTALDKTEKNGGFSAPRREGLLRHDRPRKLSLRAHRSEV